MKTIFRTHQNMLPESSYCVRYLLFLCLLLFSLSVLSQRQYNDHTNRNSFYSGDSAGFSDKLFFNGPVNGIKTRMQKPSINDRHVITYLSQNHRQFKVAGAIVLYITATDPSCGYGNGSIIIQATNGTAPYTFTLFDPYNYPTVQVIGNFPQQRAGTYTVKVSDANGLTATGSVTLTDQLPGMTGTASYIFPSSCAAKDGSFTIQITGGVPPYSYSLDKVNYQSSPTFSNLYPGIYDYAVRDANGCETGGEANLVWYSPTCYFSGGLSWSYYECTNNGNMRVEKNGNDGPYTYSIDGINYQSGNDFNNLGSGIHNVFIKNAAGTVVDVQSIDILHDCNIILDFVTVDAACGLNDGVLTANAVNGTLPYTYTIDGINYQSSNVFTGLTSGNYYVTVKDFNGFMHSKPATVYDRCPVVRATSSGESCTGNDGTITAGGFKGTAPYQFSLDGINFQASNEFTSLAAGNYIVTLKDANGFTTTTNVTVDDACLPFSITAVNATCGNANGSLTVNVTGGTYPYQYSIDGVNFQTSNIFSNLAAGSYTITVKDASSRAAGKTASIINKAGAIVTITSNPATCAGNNGSISVLGSAGTSPYLYSIDGVNFQSSNSFNNLTAGNYTAYIKDANNCITSTSGSVTSNCPTVSSVVSNETCGQTNGGISVSGNSGTPPYQYSIDGMNYQAATLFSNLKAGVYTITIKDAIGTTNTTQATVANICPKVVAIATDGLCGTANGSITAAGSNSTAPYSFSIDGTNFQTSNVFNNLSTGTYTLTVKDLNGLTSTTTVDVKNFPSPVLAVNAIAATCINNNGQVQLTSNGGVAPIRYSIDGSNYQTQSSFQSLTSGNYTAWIKDANGCIDSKPVIVPSTNDLILNTGNPVTICEGESIVLSASSNGSNFTWTPATGLNSSTLLNPTASPVSSTTYTVKATLGICSLNNSVTVNVNAAPVANAGSDITICYGKSAALSASGGVSYSWLPSTFLDNSNIQNPTVVKPATSITYDLVVKDANGCRSLNKESVTINVTPPPKVFAGNDTLVIYNQPFQLYAADINNSGFVSYSWTPPFGLNNPSIRNPTAVIDHDTKYTVKAVTGAGCEGSDDIVVKVLKGPEIYVPSAFTPNGDGLNDILKAIAVGLKEFKYFRIFNRWGELVFSTNNSSIGWNGNYKGSNPGTTVFVWTAEGIDETGKVVFRKGSVTVIK